MVRILQEISNFCGSKVNVPIYHSEYWRVGNCMDGVALSAGVALIITLMEINILLHSFYGDTKLNSS
jgi:hypothetical protein